MSNRVGARSGEGWTIRGTSASIEAWSAFRPPFEPKGEHLRYREALREAISSFAPTRAGILVAEYGGPASRFKYDIENVLLYNIGPGYFRNAAPRGVQCEVRTSLPPVAPDGREFDHYTRYDVFSAYMTFKHWEALATPRIAWKGIAWPGASAIPLAWQVWTWLQEDLDRRGSIKPQQVAAGPFSLGLTLRPPASPWPPLFASVKGLLDGTVSTLHSCGGPLSSDLIARVAEQSRQAPDTVERWLRRQSPCVVSRVSPVRLFRNAVMWHPEDDRCVAFRIVLERAMTAGTPSIDLEVYAVRPRAA